MKQMAFMLSTILISTLLLADDADWSSNDWSDKSTEEIGNRTFDEVKIKNRSKKEYDDKVYKYITGDYKAENNSIELGTVHLDDKLKNDDIEINVFVEDLKVEGNSYQDSINIKRNRYKNFVQNDEKGVTFFEEEEQNFNEGGVDTIVSADNSRYSKVPDEDITELETIDLRDRSNVREVSVFMEDVRIIVD